MNYTIKPGDTLLSIASNLTLSGAYAPAIANVNGMVIDVTSDGTIPFDVQVDLSVYGITSLTIPDNWLRGVASASGSQPLPSWLPLAAIAAVIVLS